MYKRLLILPFVFVVAVALGQTVHVDGTIGSSTPPTMYKTLSEALNSFQQTGANGGNVAPNVILIDTFGPYNEELPPIAPALSGLGTDFPTSEGITIKSNLLSGKRALLLIQTTGLFVSDGLILDDGTSITLDNVVVADSPTTSCGDDLIDVFNNSYLSLVNTSLTALPTTSTTFTEADLYGGSYDDLLAGTRNFDASLQRSGDNGISVTNFNTADNSTLDVRDSVITQQGADQIVLYGGGIVNLLPGAKMGHGSRWDIQLGGVCQVNGMGTAGDPVVFQGDGTAGRVSMWVYGGGMAMDHVNFSDYESCIIPQTGNLSFTNCSFTNMTNHGILTIGTVNSMSFDNTTFTNCAGWGVRSAGAVTNPVTISNCTFDNCGGDFVDFPSHNGAVEIGSTGNVYDISNSMFINGQDIAIWSYSDGGVLRTLDNCCFANNATGCILDVSNNSTSSSITNCTFQGSGSFALQYGNTGDSASTPIYIKDSIIAGPGGSGIDFVNKGDSNINLSYDAIVRDYGTYQLDRIQTPFSPSLLNGTVITAEPYFSSINPAAGDFFAILNDFYSDKGSSAGPLVGCSYFIGGVSPPSAVKDWTIF